MKGIIQSLTRRCWLAGIAYSMAALAQSDEGRKAALLRLVHEADAFAAKAPGILGKETLEQTTLDITRFMAGRRGDEAWPPIFKRTIVSDYGFLRLGPQEVREIRQVLTVDGKPPKRKAKALDSIAQATQTSDKERQKILESLERHGLRGVATDFGPVILIFASGHSDRFEILFNRIDTMDGEQMWAFKFAQVDGPGGMTIFERGRPIKQKLTGEIWFRASDYLPRRIILNSTHEGVKGEKLRDLSYIEYKMTDFGAILPARVVHQAFVGERVDVQDLFTYSDYREVAPVAQK
ncbi:MAG TPA: hypothetical protein VMZ52_07480 [Bryobacteraceae bacterium]|nr:hypothetical protein [Bryobacteraceae bacterium]